jgi:hypothetical protein
MVVMAVLAFHLVLLAHQSLELAVEVVVVLVIQELAVLVAVELVVTQAPLLVAE